MLEMILLIIGFVLLIKGADLFVDGSANLARNFKVPGVIIGLTIVAFGTSAPELAVSTAAALQKSNEIALSNVVGSNIFNLLSVLGICAIIHPVPVEKGIIKRDFPLSIIATIAVFISMGVFKHLRTDTQMSENVGMVTRQTGVVLVAAFIIYIIILIFAARRHPENDDNELIKSVWNCVLFIVVGIIMIVCGGQLVVNAAKEIARAMGMTETLIGLTVVAVGTSLPELVTSIVAARKNETGLAVGNAVGSNIFNLMLILGLSSIINPVVVNMASVCDMIVLIIISILTFLFSLTKNELSRVEGIVMIIMYVADISFAIIR